MSSGGSGGGSDSRPPATPRDPPGLHPDRVPGAEAATISDEKLTAYLLNPMHPRGYSKARYLAAARFTLEN